MNALDLEVQQFILDLILEVVKNYQVNGIQGDDRLPALPIAGGYDQNTKNRFKTKFNTNPPTDEKNSRWIQWRADILTEFLIDLNRKSNFQGQIFFSYEDLRKNNDAMAIALKTQAGYSQIAELPSPFITV
jgi:uncharacterized lipoprotein YddW (UPF0748 family)